MHTLGENTKRAIATVPITITATTSSEPVIDTMGFSAVLYSTLGGVLDFVTGNETYVAAVYESANANGSSPVAISGASVTFTVSGTMKSIQISGLGTGSRLRYQFLRWTLGGTTPSLVVAAVALLDGCSGQLNPADVPTVSV